MHRVRRSSARSRGLVVRYTRLTGKRLRSFWGWVRRERPLATRVEIATLGLMILTLLVAYCTLVRREPEISLELPLHSQVVRANLDVLGRIAGNLWDEWVIRLDGTEKARSSSAQIALAVDTRTLADRPYRLSVDVYHRGRLVKTETRPFEVDNTPPEIVISGVPPGSLVAGVLVVDVNVQDGILEKILLDGSQPLATPALDTRRLADGWHSITFTAVDRAGNRQSETLSFVVDNSPPRIESLGVREGSALSGRQTIIPEIAEPHLADTTWFLNGNLCATGSPLDLDTKDYKDGVYTLRLEAVDANGHASSKEITLIFDNTPPTLCIRAFRWPVFELVDRSYIRVRGVCSEAAELTYEVDGLTVAGPEILLGEFSHYARVEVKVTATDQAGNSDTKTSQVRVHPDLLDYVLEPLSWILGEDRSAGISFVKPYPAAFDEYVGIFGEVGFPGPGGVGFRFPWYAAELRGYIRPIGLGMAIPLSHLLQAGTASYGDRGAWGARSASWIEVGLIGLWPSDVTKGSEEESIAESVNWIGVGVRTPLEFADLLGGGARDVLALAIDVGLRVMSIRRDVRDEGGTDIRREISTGFGFTFGIGVVWRPKPDLCSRVLY